MRERSGSKGGYTAVGQGEEQLASDNNVPGLANAQQVLAEAQHALVDFIQARTDSSTENRKKWVLVTMVCGLCSITLGSLIIGLDPYDIIFKMKMVFSDGGETFLMWKKPDVSLFLKITLFNITNAERYMSGKDKKMTVEERGPYVYREYMEHADTVFNSNGTITAIPKFPLEFQPELSNGTEEDMMMLPNIALLSIAQVIARQSFITRLPVNVVIAQTDSQPIVPMTAREFMFGYRSKLLSYGYNIFPSWIQFDKLGLIDRMYNVEGDTSTTFTGETDFRVTGLLENYNGKTTLNQWPFPCNNVTGASDGTKFNGLLTGNETLVFFRKALCRTMEITKVGEDSIGGLRGFRYELMNNSMDNGKYESKNKCYCKRGRCMPVGLLDVSDCYYGFPIALSYPHFLDGDPALVEAFDGMQPDRKKHASYFIINDAAGIPLAVSVKLQINMALEDISSVTNVKKFSHMYLPMLWMEIAMPKLPTGLNAKFFIYLNIGPVLQEIMIYVFLTCGVAFILLSLSSSILIPRLIFDSDRRFSPSDWVPHQNMHHKKRSERLSKEEMENYGSSLLNGNGKHENGLLSEETSIDNHLHIS